MNVDVSVDGSVDVDVDVSVDVDVDVDESVNVDVDVSVDGIVNVAAYKFVALEALFPSGLVAWRDELRALCAARKLRGTILLASEGVNLFVAGARQGVDVLLSRVREVVGALDVKESRSAEQPFNRMLVKVKRETIAFGVDGIAPARYTSRRLSARELKRWLDEGRAFTLLDTRNDFEVRVGTFARAIPIGVDDFRAFPAAVERLPEAAKHGPVVTFCTGGIRCEKAAPFLERAGFTDVYQLDGGILKYFEEAAGAHYVGDCFVFDKRVALDARLQPSGHRQCYSCQAISRAEFCARCDQTPAPIAPPAPSSSTTPSRAERELAIARACSPLPGSVPYDSARPLSVPLRFDGYELLDFLDAMRTHLSRDEWARACANGQLLTRGRPVAPGRRVRSGERFYYHLRDVVEPDVATRIAIVHEDDALVVVNKPAPLPMHPCGRFNRNSLSHILGLAFAQDALRPTHRLDADTSGVVLFAKSRELARAVQTQFERGAVAKTYFARVHGLTPPAFACDAPLSAEPGERGLRIPVAAGALASTRFVTREHYADETSLVEVQPLSGRTNQIRAHLWHLGHPIVGDPSYLREGQLGVAQTLSVKDPPLCLHAFAIELAHPRSGARVRYEAPLVQNLLRDEVR